MVSAAIDSRAVGRSKANEAASSLSPDPAYGQEWYALRKRTYNDQYNNSLIGIS